MLLRPWWQVSGIAGIVLSICPKFALLQASHSLGKPLKLSHTGPKNPRTVSASLLVPQTQPLVGLTEISFPMPIWLRLGFMPVPICQMIASAG